MVSYFSTIEWCIALAESGIDNAVKVVACTPIPKCRCCPVFAPVWAFRCRGGIHIPLQEFRATLGECEQVFKNGKKSQYQVDFLAKFARSKCVQVKGRVALKSLLARFTPPVKAVRGFSVPPRKSPFTKSGGLYQKFIGRIGNLQVACLP